MESIDITDSTFALDANELFSNSDISQNNYDIYYILFIGICVILGVIFGWFLYRTFLKKDQVNDCDGGFCTMNQPHRETN